MSYVAKRACLYILLISYDTNYNIRISNFKYYCNILCHLLSTGVILYFFVSRTAVVDISEDRSAEEDTFYFLKYKLCIKKALFAMGAD